MSEIYTIIGDNQAIAEAVEKSVEASTEEAILIPLNALKIANKIVSISIDQEGKPFSSHTIIETDHQKLVVVKYQPTEPNTARQVTNGEEATNVTEIETEQRSAGLCFFPGEHYPKFGALTVPKISKLAILEVFNKNEV